LCLAPSGPKKNKTPQRVQIVDGTKKRGLATSPKGNGKKHSRFLQSGEGSNTIWIVRESRGEAEIREFKNKSNPWAALGWEAKRWKHLDAPEVRVQISFESVCTLRF